MRLFSVVREGWFTAVVSVHTTQAEAEAEALRSLEEARTEALAGVALGRGYQVGPLVDDADADAWVPRVLWSRSFQWHSDGSIVSAAVQWHEVELLVGTVPLMAVKP